MESFAVGCSNESLIAPFKPITKIIEFLDDAYPGENHTTAGIESFYSGYHETLQNLTPLEEDERAYNDGMVPADIVGEVEFTLIASEFFFSRFTLSSVVESELADLGGGEGDSWYKPDGSLNYPPNGGAVPGTEEIIDFQPGRIAGRFGTYGPTSDYVCAPGSAVESLSLPPYTDTSIYQEFTVLKPISGVTQSTVAPWGGPIGGGIQYQLPMPIFWYIEYGYIV